MNPVRISIGAALIVAALLVFGAPESAQALNPNHSCSYCHSLHSAPGGTLKKAITTELVCLTCHGPGGPSVLKADKHQGQSCANCHTPHSNLPNVTGGTNLKLVGVKADGTGLARMLTPGSGIRDVVFETRGTGVGQPAAHSFADGDGVFDGACEVCHTLAAFHRNNPSGDHAHRVGATCTNCHQHEKRFAGNCATSGCHFPGSALDPMTTAGSGTAGKHVVHVTIKGQTCQTCHSQYFQAATHDNGVLNGKTDTVAPVAFNTLSPTGAYTDQSPSGSGTCASTSCHRTSTPDWYDAAPALTWPTVCTDCHTPGSPIDPLTIGDTGTAGKHTRHVTDRGIACVQCHSGHDPNPQTVSLHMDGKLDADESNALVAFRDPENSAGAWQQDTGAQAGTCANLYCHGATGDQGLTGVPNEPEWYGGSLVPAWAASTAYALDDIVVPVAANGRHYKAVAAGVSGAVAPTWPTGFKARVVDGTVTWKAQTATAGLPCEACHSAGSFTDPLIINATGAAGKHGRHAGDSEYECTQCHNGYNANAAHANFQFDGAPATAIVAFSPTYNPVATWNTGNQTCASLYCHGASNSGVPNVIGGAVRTDAGIVPSWYTSTPLNCRSCHTAASFLNPTYRDSNRFTGLYSGSQLQGWHSPHFGNLPSGTYTNGTFMCEGCHYGYAAAVTHGSLNEIDPAGQTREARVLDSLVNFHPDVAQKTPPGVAPIWVENNSGSTGVARDGVCKNSLCHIAPVNELHNGGIAPLVRWYNN